MDLPNRKRGRGEGDSVDRRLRLARYLSLREAKQFPRSTYGRAYYKRGSAASLGLFGPSYKQANAAQRAERQVMGFTGRGKYRGRGSFWSDITDPNWRRRQVASVLGTSNTRALEGLANSAISAGINELPRLAAQYGPRLAMMAGMGRYYGRGAYSQNSNSLCGGNMETVPRMSSASDETGALTICRKEYITDISGSSAFTNQNWYINAANPVLFPWLAQTAQNYDIYEFVQLIFEYKSVTSVLSTTATQVGTIMMACEYNVSLAPFNTKQSMLEYDSAVSSQINENSILGIECDPRKNASISNVLYTSTAQTTTGLVEDPKTLFLGLFQLATNQCVNTTGEIGELWVSYTVRLRKPKLFTALLKNQMIAQSEFLVSSLPLTNNLNPTNSNAIGFPIANLYVGSTILNAATNAPQANFLATPTSGNSPATGFQFGYRFPNQLQQGTYTFSVLLQFSSTLPVNSQNTQNMITLHGSSNVLAQNFVEPGTITSSNPGNTGAIQQFMEFSVVCQVQTDANDANLTTTGGTYIGLQLGGLSQYGTFVAMILTIRQANDTLALGQFPL